MIFLKKLLTLLFFTITVSFFANQVYEKVIFKSGSWLIDQQDFEGKQILVIRHEGGIDLLRVIPEQRKDSVSFSIDSDIVLRSVYLACEDAKSQKITIEGQGKTFGPYQTARMEGGEYIFEPDTEIVLKKGSYVIKFSDPSILIHDPITGPAVVVTGIDAELYKSSLKQNDEEESIVAGQSTLLENKPAQKLGTIPQSQKKPIQFTIEEGILIEQMAIDLISKPVDLPKTFIVIYDKSNRSYGPYYVKELDDENMIIFFEPMVALKPDTYTVRMSDESAINYDRDGRPIYALKSFEYFDFTGTYKMNFKVTRVRTLKGASEKTTLDVKLFEVGLIDHGDFIELVGKIDLAEVVNILQEQTGRKISASYEGQVFPFSQACEIVERSKESVKCRFSLRFNFTNMPIVNRFIFGEANALVVMTFSTRPGLAPGVTISGSAKYLRTYDPHLGTDINDYVISGDGYRVLEKLPAFVINAMSKNFASAGNIPGPGSAEQAATGLLFPPLIAAIGYALQELLKPKPGGVSQVFADYTRAARGAARRAAAREAAKDSSSVSQEASEPVEEEFEEEEFEEEQQEPEQTYEEAQQEVQKETSEPRQEQPQEQTKQPAPVTLTVVADHTGRTKEVTYDPETDQWITEDGNLFNWEVYEKIVLPNLEKDRAWIEKQREKMMEPTRIESEPSEKEKYIQNLEKKYGVSRQNLREHISKDIDENLGAFQKFKNNADWYDSAYKVAKGTQIIADNAIDGLAACTGVYGKSVRAVYKAAKAFVPDEDGKGITFGKAIETGADIASDFIPFSSPWKEAAFKTAGAAIGGGVDEGWKGFGKKLVESGVSNSFEAFAKTIGGKGYGDDVSSFKSKWWNPEMSNLMIPTGSSKNVGLLTSSSGKDISGLVSGKIVREIKLQGTKTAAAFTSEMYVKPWISGD